MKLSVALATSLAAAGIPQPTALPPVGRWRVAYEDQACTLSRSFGSPTAPVEFVLKPWLSAAGVEIVLLMPPGKGRAVRRGKGRVLLAPSNKIYPLSYDSGPIKDLALRAIDTTQEDAAFRADLSDATSITIDAGEPVPVTLELTAARSAMRALKGCEDDLLKGWGIDPATPPAMAAAPVHTFFGPDAYPAEALSAHAQGKVIAALTVDPRGRVTACRIVVSAGNAALDRTTCSIARERVRFAPSSDTGKPGRRSILPVTWSLPG